MNIINKSILIINNPTTEQNPLFKRFLNKDIHKVRRDKLNMMRNLIILAKMKFQNICMKINTIYRFIDILIFYI